MRFGSSHSCCFCRAEHMAVSGGIRVTLSAPAGPPCAHPRSPWQLWASQTSCITLSLQPCHQQGWTLGRDLTSTLIFFSCCCFLKGRWKVSHICINRSAEHMGWAAAEVLWRQERNGEGSENLPPAQNCSSWALKIIRDSLAGTCFVQKPHTEDLTESTPVNWAGVQRFSHSQGVPCHGQVSALVLHFSSRVVLLLFSLPSRLHTRLGALLTALEKPVCLNNLIKQEQRDSFPLLSQHKKRSLSHYLLLGSLCFFN